MSRKINKNSPAKNRKSTQNLARLVRGITNSLTVPLILTACAPVPHISPEAGNSSNSQAKTILYVVRPGGSKDEEPENQLEPTFVGPPAPQQIAAPLVKLKDGSSPYKKYPPLASDSQIFESILSKSKPAHDFRAHGRKPAIFARLSELQAAGLNPAAPATTTKVAKDGLWDKVRKRLMLTGYEHEFIQAEVEKIKRSPGNLNFLSKRAEPFLYFVVDEIERRGLPMDLAMVPMVESAFEPAAVSPKQAAGIWQFIPGTATENGLRLVEGYDGRYDVYASTKAALKYLSRLQALFGGDWLLALAAYNAGEGAVQKAIQANQKAGLGTGFWDLNLPSETKAYVPRVLALSRVVSDPGSFGVTLHKISPFPYLARVEIQGEPVQLGQTVTSLGMSWEEFYSMNPAFKPDAAPSAPFNLLLPLDKAQMLVASLQGSKLIAARKYVVKKGETLTVIARQQGVPTLKLAEWNGLQADSRVKPGQELIIFPV